MPESADTDRGGLHALDQRPMSPRQRYAALLVAFGEFIDGYDLLVIGGALIFLRPQFHLSPAETGALGAAGFLGAMVGLVVFGVLVQISTRPPYKVREVRSEKRYWYLP